MIDMRPIDWLQFAPGAQVEFDDAAEGTLRGTVMGTIPMARDIRHSAVILIGESKLSGIIWTVPLIELRLLAAPRKILQRPDDPDAPGNVVTILDND